MTTAREQAKALRRVIDDGDGDDPLGEREAGMATPPTQSDRPLYRNPHPKSGPDQPHRPDLHDAQTGPASLEAQAGRGYHHWQHEPCWHAVKRTGKGQFRAIPFNYLCQNLPFRRGEHKDTRRTNGVALRIIGQL